MPPESLTRPAPPATREAIRFFIPGPSYVREAVRAALAAPVVGHRSEAFRTLYARVTARLPPLLRTAGEVYVATGSSTLVMEAAIVSTVASRVLNLTCGSFSERWHTICQSLGRQADRLSVPWGEAVDPDLLRRALRRERYEAVTIVHNETSTGVMNPLADLARTVREESDALVLVDAVSSLGGSPVETDDWGLDLVLAGVQKCLAAPPGLVVFTLSERAAERARALPHRGFYCDLLRYRASHRDTGSTITTPAVPLFYALERQLEAVAAEGLERRCERHAGLRRATEEWARRRGLAYASTPAAPSPTVSCLKSPAAMPARELVRRLAAAGFTVAGGYADWKETTFRIGHMGEVQAADLDDLLAAIDAALEGRA
jgi:aspartate aminotransferase-like enzyme